MRQVVMRALPRTVAVGVENTDMMDILDLLEQDLDDTQSRTERECSRWRSEFQLGSLWGR